MVEETLDPGPAGHTLQLVRTGEELEAAARARLHYPASLALGRLLDTRVTRSVFRGPLPEIFLRPLGVEVHTISFRTKCHSGCSTTS
jgi:hypothetical protein